MTSIRTPASRTSPTRATSPAATSPRTHSTTPRPRSSRSWVSRWCRPISGRWGRCRHPPRGQPAGSVGVAELVHHVLRHDAEGYAQAYRDGVNDLAARLLHPEGTGAQVAAALGGAARGHPQATWGIQATRAFLAAVRPRREGRGARHRVRPRPPRLRGPRRHRAVLRRGRVGAGRPRSRNALHRHLLRAAHALDRPALRRRPRGRHLRREGAQQLRQRHGRRDPRRYQLGGGQPLPRHLHVARRPVPQAHPPYSAAGHRALAAGITDHLAAGNNADRRAGTSVSWAHRPTASRSWPSVRWTCRWAWPISPRAACPGAGAGRRRRAGLAGLLVVADAHRRGHQRHQHGHAARGRAGRALGGGDRPPWPRALGNSVHGERAAPAAVTRRRNGARAGTPVEKRAPGATSPGWCS